MNLKGLVAVSGKPGLYKIIGQNKSGFVLESLDAQKLKLIVNLSTAKLASLEDITIFGEEGDIKLTDIFEKMKDAASIPDAKADGKVLRTFFREVAPDHDEDKVYASDMKKIILWFNIIKELPLFQESPEAESAEMQDEVAGEETAEVASEAQPEKKAAKKTKKAE